MKKKPDSKKIAKEDTKVALKKAADKKQLNPGKTQTGQPADPVVQNPVVPGVVGQTYN
jgi:hypothetical protein